MDDQKHTEVKARVNELKVEAFYNIRKWLNLDFPDPNAKPWEKHDNEPFLDEDDEEYISLVLDELTHRVRLEMAIAYNKDLIARNEKELEQALKDKEASIQSLIKLGYKRQEIEKRLKEDLHD